uniref:Uncharacterized protein n=1 Tax=Branchiostoma floridae TaxID=7739 RepID=C3YYY6_BRAFL|eukprot:XP_002598482.1 hypothetical protein BRAFLDRAFT_66859 [Branchiostoma floridae]
MTGEVTRENSSLVPTMGIQGQGVLRGSLDLRVCKGKLELQVYEALRGTKGQRGHLVQKEIPGCQDLLEPESQLKAHKAHLVRPGVRGVLARLVLPASPAQLAPAPRENRAFRGLLASEDPLEIQVDRADQEAMASQVPLDLKVNSESLDSRAHQVLQEAGVTWDFRDQKGIPALQSAYKVHLADPGLRDRLDHQVSLDRKGNSARRDQPVLLAHRGSDSLALLGPLVLRVLEDLLEVQGFQVPREIEGRQDHQDRTVMYHTSINIVIVIDFSRGRVQDIQPDDAAQSDHHGAAVPAGDDQDVGGVQSAAWGRERESSWTGPR